MSVWIHISDPGKSGVAGPFSGNGQFQLMSAGIHVYATQANAQKAPAQVLTQTQANVVAQVALEGPGIGQGFFGLGGDVGKAASAAADPFHGLNLGNILLRSGEIILGVVLIGVGIAKLTGVSNGVSKLVKAKL